MKNNKINIKSEKLKLLMRKGGRMGAKGAFSELLRRAVFPGKTH